MYILAAERDPQAFDRYAAYLAANEARFPPRAYALATSDWYFDARDHRSPHDAWLEAMQLVETNGVTSLTVRLLGAYHDGHIELHYPKLATYRFEATVAQGHRDWRYDELRVDADGRLEHEIEWSGPGPTGRWLIVADDVRFTWRPAT